MILTKENFVEFLTYRLKPNSAKSYLDYVEGFKKVIKRNDDYLYSGTEETKVYILQFLNKQARPPALKKLAKSYQSNIRTGIRSLLYYYDFEKVKILKQSANRKALLKLNSENFLEEYKFWLSHRYLKPNGEKFKSVNSYIGYLKMAYSDLSMEHEKFCRIEKSDGLKEIIKNLKANPKFTSRAKHTQHSILSSLSKCEVFLSEFYGEKREELFDK